MPLDQPRSQSAVRGMRVVGLAAGFGLCVLAFYDARSLNGGFALPRKGVLSVPQTELVFYVWYALYGSIATGLLALLLTELRVERLWAEVMERALARPEAFVNAIALACFALSVAFRHLVLLDQPVTDDEGTYVFIARTLLAGRLSNPAPADPEFFANQFVVLNAHAWYGKYPIGHPLVLALGEAIGRIDLVMPALGALSVVLCHRVGRRLFDERVALIGASLLLASPHFVWTHATLLSQPTACTLMLLGTWALLRLSDAGQLRWAVLAGAAFGFGVLVRPLPGVPFACAAWLYCAIDSWRSGRGVAVTLRRTLGFACAALPFGLALLAANQAQSGDALTTGYHAYHGAMPLLESTKGRIANSVGGALIRENFWLFGWTFALALVPFSRPRRSALLFWGMLAAELAYRVLSPKTVVAVTGPVYLTEVVPLLSLAVADAARRIGGFFSNARLRPSAVALAASITGLCLFVPLQLGALLAGAEARRVVYDELERSGAERALVFADALATQQQALTWAYFPDNPGPQLDDRWLFVRLPRAGDVHARMLDFWQRRFPERRAFAFLVTRDGRTNFSELRAAP